jgi:NhaP-type Na+/H+ or K+/H+ antiporter
MVIWVAAVVLFTLTVNASLLGPLMTALGLNKTTPAQRHMHRCKHISRCVNDNTSVHCICQR